ncbi:MAG: GGDEF domain-containing protein [Neorhizobium sp.]|nr:GGDEF domain-containing protein [Neorhizobium sp.]
MDIVTGFMIWAAEASTLGVLLWTRWFYERQSYYLTWGGGFLLHGAGIALIAFRGAVPDFISIELANTAALAGIGLWVAGMLQFDGRRVEPFVAIPALIWIAGMFLNPIRETFAYRVALFNVAAAVGYSVLIAITLYRQTGSTFTRRVFSGFVGLQTLSSLTVGVMALINQPEAFDSNSRSPWLLMTAALCFVASVMSCAKLINERSEAKLKALALTDPLTGVLNRRGLIDEFHRLQKNDCADKPLIALLQFDLDSFKQINDLCGHQAGDAVLVAFSSVGQMSLRGRGQFGRMGGEEFASILRVADMVEAASIAEAVRTTLKRQPLDIGQHKLTVTVSTGIAFAGAENANLDVLLSSADRALYAAKAAGRDRSAIGDAGEITIVPSIDRTEPDMADLDGEANRQVAALKRIAAIGH